MKKILTCWGILAIAAIFLPTEGFSKTKAYSPSIPGQPLIFHHQTKTNCLFDHKAFHKLSSKELETLFKLSEASIGFSEELLGLIEIMFLPINLSSKESAASIYAEEINFLISDISNIFSSRKAPISKKLSNLMKQTLLSFAQITNQMLIDSWSNTLFQQDYLEMQQQVINYFKSELTSILKNDRQASFRIEAESALERSVSCLALYISNLNALTNGNYAGPRSVALSRQQMIKNLTLFIEFTFALTVSNYNK